MLSGLVCCALKSQEQEPHIGAQGFAGPQRRGLSRGLGFAFAKSSRCQGALPSEAKPPYTEAEGHWRAGAGARVWSPLPPGPSKAERPGLPHLAHNQRWGNRSPPRGAGHVASYLSTDLKSHRSAASPIHTRPGSQIQTHVGAGTRTLLGPRAPASRRRALHGAAQGGAVVVSRFPLLARS